MSLLRNGPMRRDFGSSELIWLTLHGWSCHQFLGLLSISIKCVYEIKAMWQHRNVWKTTWEQNATRSVYQNNNNNKQYLAKTHKYWKSSLVSCHMRV